MPHSSCNSSLGVLVPFHLGTDHTDFTPSAACRTVPTEDEILVPETLLKKRKSQEKAREERSAELEKKKKVSSVLDTYFQGWEVLHDGDDNYHTYD